jgi:hypothetical protein
LRSYIGEYRLQEDLYYKWSLDKKLKSALSNLGLQNSIENTDIILVELTMNNIMLEDFISWFRNRNLYIKLDKSNLINFSRSLENLVWLMVRDKLLIHTAKTNNYFDRGWVKRQSKWWKEKIAYSAYRNKLINSIALNDRELNRRSTNMDQQNLLETESVKKIFHEISRLRTTYDVYIDYDVLNKIRVSVENDKHAINLYTAKNRSLIPRPPYPTIDNDWSNWL